MPSVSGSVSVTSTLSSQQDDHSLVSFVDEQLDLGGGGGGADVGGLPGGLSSLPLEPLAEPQQPQTHADEEIDDASTILGSQVSAFTDLGRRVSTTNSTRWGTATSAPKYSELMKAACAGDVDSVQEMIELGHNMFETDSTGRTALDWARIAREEACALALEAAMGKQIEVLVRQTLSPPSLYLSHPRFPSLCVCACEFGPASTIHHYS